MSHYWDDYEPSAAELQQEEEIRQMCNTPVSSLIEKGVTISELIEILTGSVVAKPKYPVTALSRFKKVMKKAR